MFIDIHCHVIWGVDDGGNTEEETLQMLRDAAADGIHKIIVTPHMTPGVYEFPEERFQLHLARARRFVQEEGLNLELCCGAELLYTDLTPRLLQERKVPTLDGTRHPLIEFSPTDSWEHIHDALQKVCRAGFSPIIAHMERYPAIKSTDQVRRLKESFQTLVQINARSLTKKQPLLRRKFFDRLFQENLTDFIATDTHSMPGRGTCMTEGMEALRKKYGEQCADRILRNTEYIFGDD